MGGVVRQGLVALGVGALAVPLLAATAGAASPATSQGRVALPHSSPQWASTTNAVGSVPVGASVRARVYLAPQGGQARLNAAVTAVSTPGSTSYRHFLTPAQYQARFGPTRTQISGVTSWLRGAGLRVTGLGAGNRYVEVSGRPDTVQSAFGVGLRLYRHQGRVEQAPSGDVTVPTELAGEVLGVTGLASAQRMHPAAASYPPPAGFVNARPCSAYYGQLLARYQADYKTPLPKFQGYYRNYAVCGYVPTQLRGAYGVTGSNLSGKGVTVAITDAYAAPTIASDANRYATSHGDAAFGRGQFSQSTPSAPYRFANQCGPSGWFGEETLDVEAVHGIAPGANVRYYASRSCFDSDFLDTLARVVDQNKASLVSNSWGEASQFETSGLIAAYEQVFKQGALQGIGFLYSSGDSGDDLASTGLKQTDYPTSDPYVTSVGGTSDAISSNNTMQFQAGWGTDKYALASNGRSWLPVASNPFIYGAGGGYSNLFNRPAYQDGVVPASRPPGRAVPDIAMDADPTTGMLVGETQGFAKGVHYSEFRIGGTSLASPLMAGMQALASEGAGARIGFANPMIYALARSGAKAYSDVTGAYDGRANVRPDYANGVDPSGGILYSVRTFGDDASLAATRGWDDVTGVGSPTGRYFAAVSGR